MKNTKSIMSIVTIIILLVSVLGLSGSALAQDKKFDVTLNVVGVNNVISEVVLEHQDELYDQLGIRINFQQFSNEQASNKLAVSFAAGGGDVDAFMFRPLDETLLFVQNGWLENLQPYVDANPEAVKLDDFYPASLGLCKNQATGDIVGFPLMVESAVIFYNKTLFAEKGITETPKTMDELYALAGKLNDPDNDICGFACRGAGNPSVTQFSCFLRAFGGDFLDADGNAVINTPEAIAAFEFYGKLLRDYGPDGVLNMGWTDTWNLLTQGKAAMRMDANTNMGSWDPDNSLLDLSEIGYFQVPVGPKGDHGDFLITAWAIGVSSGSANKDAAIAFANWVASPEIQIEVQKRGGSGSRKCCWSDAYSSWPEALQRVSDAAAQVAVSTDRPYMINVSKARDIIGEIVVAAIEGGTDITALANARNADFQALIDSEK
ncbi:MAG: sugar ABC transporter substrate-binding protein [Clostridia bacterium]